MSQLLGVGVPSQRFTSLSTQANFNGAVLIQQRAFADAYAVVEGIDLVSNTLSVDDQARIYFANPGSGQPNTILFFAFVYAQSQGYFAWRGSVVCYPNLQLLWDALFGNWSVSVWGRVEPAITLQP